MLILVIWHIICSFNIKYLIINLKKNIQFNNIWIFIILIGNSVSILSQNMPNVGNENWLGGNLSLKVNKHWELNLENQFRYSIDDMRFDRNFTEFQITKKVNDYFNWGISYRYIVKNHDFENIFQNYNRYNYFITQNWDFGSNNRFNLKYRFQYQRRRENFLNTNKFIGELRKFWRFKTTLSYNIKKWKFDPKLGIEFFVRGNNHPTDQFNKYRISIGTKKKVNKRQNISFKYMFEKQYKSWNPEVFHVLAIKYNYQLKHQTKNHLIE